MVLKKRPFAWSISRLLSYETCPLKRKFEMDKIPTPPNKYLVRGIAVHKLGEDYLKNKLKTVPVEYKLFAKQLKQLKKDEARSELELAFTRDWKLTGWWDDPWLRIKIDAVTYDKGMITIVDFKTGRPKPQDDQARIYQAGTMLEHPEIKSAATEFWYLDHGVTFPKKPVVVKRANFLSGAQREFEVRAGRMEKETKFKPTPGGHCSWCDFSKRKGGPCKF